MLSIRSSAVQPALLVDVTCHWTPTTCVGVAAAELAGVKAVNSSV